MRSNNLVGADCLGILMTMQRLLAAPQPERCSSPSVFSGLSKGNAIATNHFDIQLQQQLRM